MVKLTNTCSNFKIMNTQSSRFDPQEEKQIVVLILINLLSKTGLEGKEFIVKQ